jgi:hypothetical protein
MLTAANLMRPVVSGSTCLTGLIHFPKIVGHPVIARSKSPIQEVYLSDDQDVLGEN